VGEVKISLFIVFCVLLRRRVEPGNPNVSQMSVGGVRRLTIRTDLLWMLQLNSSVISAGRCVQRGMRSCLGAIAER